MQQHAGPARPQHHNLFAGGGFHGIQLHDRLARRFMGEILRRALGPEPLQFVTPAATRVALLRHAIRLSGQRQHAHAGQRLAVIIQHTVAGGNQHLA